MTSKLTLGSRDRRLSGGRLGRELIREVGRVAGRYQPCVLTRGDALLIFYELSARDVVSTDELDPKGNDNCVNMINFTSLTFEETKSQVI